MNTFKDIIKEAGTMCVGLLFLFAGTMSYMLLAFAERDFSFLPPRGYASQRVGISEQS